MKAYIENSKGTIYRIDKFSWIKGKLPSEVDWSRRILLSGKAKPKPYELALVPEEYQKLCKAINEKVIEAPLKVYNQNNACILLIWKKIETQKS